MAIPRICTAAKNYEVSFAYRVAIPRQRFNFKNAFSTRCLALYKYLSYSRWLFLLLRGGITTVIPLSAAVLTISSLLQPLSAMRQSASMPSTSLQACVQSAAVPDVTSTLTGIPCASTARCIFELSPLGFSPCPGCRLLRRLRRDGLLYDLRRS